MKKRKIFNTILVNNDTKTKIDIINSRKEDDVIEALKKFKKIETVTRDFSQTYKNAIDKTHPNALQIVDRFHILTNLTDDINTYMKRKIENNIKLTSVDGEILNEEKILNQRQKEKKAYAEKRWKVVLEVKELYNDGINITNISKKLNISRQTVYTYLSEEKMMVADKGCILDDVIPEIKKYIILKMKNKDIFQKLKETGYTGGISLFNSRIRGIRQEVKNNTHYLKRSHLKLLLYFDLDDIKIDETIKDDIRFYLGFNPEFSKIITIKNKFKKVLFSKKPKLLDSWLKKAEKLNIDEINSFIKLIKRDYDAVKNAIIYDYSNGVTEGFNNKTKVIKRVMYGRCSHSLLRTKILLA